MPLQNQLSVLPLPEAINRNSSSAGLFIFLPSCWDFCLACTFADPMSVATTAVSSCVKLPSYALETLFPCSHPQPLCCNDL